jgi:hypothetical protein
MLRPVAGYDVKAAVGGVVFLAGQPIRGQRGKLVIAVKPSPQTITDAASPAPTTHSPGSSVRPPLQAAAAM